MKCCKICKKIQKASNGTFFKVSNEERRLKWSRICGIDFRRHEVVCMDHFSASHIINAGTRIFLLPTAVPTMPECNPAVMYPAPFDAKQWNVLKKNEIDSTENNSDIPAMLQYEDKQAKSDTRLAAFKCALCQKNCLPEQGKYFRVPEDENRRKLWSESCRMQLLPNTIICEDHFAPTSFIKFKNQSTLLPNAVPSPPRLSKSQIEAHIGSDREIVIDDDNRSEISVNVPINSSCLNLEDPLNLNRIPLIENDQSGKIYVNKEVQTDPIMFPCDRYDAKRCRQLETEIKDLKLQIMQTSMAMNSIYKIFTEGQIRKLMSPSVINWRDHDMERALELYKAGTRAYKYLYKKGYPLPHISSLQRWRRKSKMNKINNSASYIPLKQTDEETEEEEDEVNDFSGDDNDWFDDFYEENNTTTKPPESEVLDTPMQNNEKATENQEDRNKKIPQKEADRINAPSIYSSPDLNAIMASYNSKVFIAKKPSDIDKSKEQNVMVNAQNTSKTSVIATPSLRTQREMPNLNCVTPVRSIEATMERLPHEEGSRENSNAVIETEDESLDYSEFLSSIDSDDYLIEED